MLHEIHLSSKIRGDRIPLGGTLGIYQHKQKDPKGGYSYLAKVGGGPLHLREVRGTKKEVW
jgi:hypothetical protein